MSVAAVGVYQAPALLGPPQPYNPYVQPYAPVAPAPAPWGQDQYQPAQAPVQAQSGGLTWPRMLAWAGGALAAGKLILPHLGSPGGLVTALVIGGGAFAGEKVYGAVKGAGAQGAGGGDVVRYASWAGGAFAAWKIGRPLIGNSPSGWLIGGLVVAGAWAGNKLYSMVTGRV